MWLAGSDGDAKFGHIAAVVGSATNGINNPNDGARYGELTVKRLRYKNGLCFLEPENNTYKPIQINEDMAFEVWGVVTNVIHKV